MPPPFVDGRGFRKNNSFTPHFFSVITETMEAGSSLDVIRAGAYEAQIVAC